MFGPDKAPATHSRPVIYSKLYSGYKSLPDRVRLSPLGARAVSSGMQVDIAHRIERCAKS